MSLTLRCLLSDQPLRRPVALFARAVVVLVVTAVSLTAVDAALAGPPPGLPALPVPDNTPPPTPASGQQPQSPPQSQPQSQPSQPSTTAPASPAAVANLTVRKDLAKLGFPCQNAGTAKLVVRYSRHRWTSATKKYACSQSQAKASVRVTKSIARRLRKPSPSMAASLLIKDGTNKSLPVNLPAAFRAKPTAHAALDESNFWGDDPETWCSSWDFDDGRGPQGTMQAFAPPLYIDPTVGGEEWFYWRSWLLVWDGKYSRWELVAGQATGTLTPTVWNSSARNPIQYDNLSVSIADGVFAGEQDYSITGGFDAYAIAAAQSATYVNGQWYFSPVKWLRNYAPFSDSVGDFCYFR